jgi:very-short-patch-repair endonuclease
MAGTEQGIPKPDVPEQLQKLELEKDRLPSWLAFCRIFDRCKRCGVIDFAMATVREEIPEETLCQTYQLTLLERIGNQQLEQTGIGFSFTAEEMEEFRKSFQFYDRQLMKSKSLDIQSKMKGQYIPEGNAKGRVGELTELSLIRHEIAKKTRHCRIRDLMLRAGNSVQALKPCFLMSPLSLSRYIPSDSLKFDLVIMDEASQIKPEDAIGAILRARQLVVVGDPKQLPPTSFFDQLIEEIEDEEATQFDNAESILEVAMRSFQPYRRLRWHYRSRHEDLIEFSNERFYDRDLVIFPSAVGRSRGYGIQYHFVEDATCAKGVNVVEAQAIVQRIVEHARSNPTESLGVAAFNQKQAEVIQDLLDEACDSSNEVSDAIAKLRELDDELFVKNLESIQGDERDVMFISYTYGPDPATGRVFQRFGPINSDQGWRRLNVMVTRARKRMEVFSSLKSGDIQGGPDKSRGVNAYKQFLEFVQSGRISEVGAETGRPPGSPFEEAVAKVICECGLEPVFQVGVAGYFIDIGVRKKEGDRDFVLGIECDGASYHSSRSVRDRDRLREEIIQSRGWKLYRIWSTEWFLNQSQEEARLKRFLTALTVDPLIDGKSS